MITTINEFRKLNENNDTPQGQKFNIGDIVKISSNSERFKKEFQSHPNRKYEIEYSFFQKYGGKEERHKNQYKLKFIHDNGDGGMMAWLTADELEYADERNDIKTDIKYGIVHVNYYNENKYDIFLTPDDEDEDENMFDNSLDIIDREDCTMPFSQYVKTPQFLQILNKYDLTGDAFLMQHFIDNDNDETVDWIVDGKEYFMIDLKAYNKIINNPELKQLNNIENNINNVVTQQPIKAKNTKHLKELINANIKQFGKKCNLNNIDVSDITDMSYVFQNSKFNGDISKWDVSYVTDMSSMFHNSKFNGDISKWDVSNVTDMGFMFKDSQFDGDISEWDVSNVTDMSFMFNNSQFDSNIDEWDVSNDTDMNYMFEDSDMQEPKWY